MTLTQIMKHKRGGLTVKVEGRDAKITGINEPASKVTVTFFDGTSATVSFYDVKTEWAGEWTPPATEASMIKLEAKKMVKAIERAKTIRPRVKVINADDRTYSVSGSRGNSYTVRFAVANGHRLGACDCPSRVVCYHICAAAQVNVMCQSMRRGASAPVAIWN